MPLSELPDPPNIEELKAKGDVQGLIKALDHEQDWLVRKAAAEAIGQIGDAQAVEPLVAALKDEENSVRRAAVMALGRIGDAQAVEPLVTALKDKDLSVRTRAVEALGRIADVRVVEALLAAFKAKYDAQQAEEKALTRIINAKSAQSLGVWPRDEDLLLERVIIANVLGQIGGKQAIEALEAALKDAEEQIRQAAAAVLGQIGAVRAVGPLVELLYVGRDSDLDAAIEALLTILKSAAMDIATEDLRQLAGLASVVRLKAQYSRNLYIGDKTIPVDCSHLKQLAQQELIRRGLEV